MRLIHAILCKNKNMMDIFLRGCLSIIIKQPLKLLVTSLMLSSSYMAMAQRNHIEMEKRNIEECLNLKQETGMCHKQPMTDSGIVRLSKIEVYPQFLEEYLEYAREVGEISLCTEPGVLTMYAVQEKENPCMITILETYASKEAYQYHISSPHFQKYKQGTLHMVKDLVLSDQNVVNPANTLHNYINCRRYNTY